MRPEEQQCLREKRVAIAGMGGVGGAHLLTLTRLGVGRFSVADFDTFEIHNFNRQMGATLSSVGKPKVEVLHQLAQDINPELAVRVFPEGVTADNLDAFLEGVDLYVDGLDFFAFSARQRTFEACAQRNIPVITAAPLGMGAAVLNFMPGGISFEDYFCWGQKASDEAKALKFLLGLAPGRLHFDYLVEASSVNLREKRGPSTVMACQLCAGMAATEALKILLGRGKVWAAPYSYQFDAYHTRLVRCWRPGGNRHFLQRIALRIAERRLRKLSDLG
ncbi:MAG: ThiF family adenylyltransferase [Betaproteobacteria bacterium]|nr:ThiF family adenylyltransferase [Betaproteobacteria bacterium]